MNFGDTKREGKKAHDNNHMQDHGVGDTEVQELNFLRSLS